MAENKAKGSEHDDFVSKVSKDPSKPADALLLSGFVGKSSEEGHTRLHFDPELKHFVDIPNDAILAQPEDSRRPFRSGDLMCGSRATRR